MIDFQQISKYKLLNEFTQKVSLNRFCALVYGFDFSAAWYACDSLGKQYFNWNFLERRQLFFELVVYYLTQNMIKFGRKITFAREDFIWDETTDIEQTIIYLEKGFSKNENIFLNGKRRMPQMFGDIDIDSKEGYKKVIEYPSENYEINMYIYFYGYCPSIAYWNEESKSWIWGD